jgi:hypothetical protein
VVNDSFLSLDWHFTGWTLAMVKVTCRTMFPNRLCTRIAGWTHMTILETTKSTTFFWKRLVLVVQITLSWNFW